MKHTSIGGYCSSVDTVSESAAASLQRRLLRLGALGAASMSLLLAGCSNSPTNAAAANAASASAEAAHYLATAGDYRPATSFPDQFRQPLTATALRADEQSAMRNPAAYLAKNGLGFTSSKRDIRHAISLLTDAIDNAATTWEYKRVLYAQRALCEDQLAAMKTQMMQSEVAIITRQLHTLDYSTLYLTHYAKKISYLTAQHKSYSRQYASALRAAKHHQQKMELAAAEMESKLHRMQTVLAAVEAQRKADLIRGARLELQSRMQMGEESLSTLRAGTRLLNAAAKISVPIELSRLRMGRMKFALALAQNRVSHAKAQVVELAFQRAISEKIARHAAEQLKSLQSAVRAMIYGTSAENMSVDRSASAIQKSLAELDKLQVKATAEYQAADQDFTMAINSQSTAYSVAAKLVDAHVHESNPMVQTLQDKSPEALLQIFKAASTLSEAQMLRMVLMGKTLQKSAAQFCDVTYKLIGKSSPISALKAGYLTSLRKNVILKMDSATAALSQAKMEATNASEDIRWLEPAYSYAVNAAIAETATEPAIIAKAKKLAIQAAKQANSLNPALNLPLSFKAQ